MAMLHFLSSLKLLAEDAWCVLTVALGWCPNQRGRHQQRLVGLHRAATACPSFLAIAAGGWSSRDVGLAA